jgi:hypothetical protein
MTNVPSRYRVVPQHFGLLMPGQECLLSIEVLTPPEREQRENQDDSPLSRSRTPTSLYEGGADERRRSRSATLTSRSKSIGNLLTFRADSFEAKTDGVASVSANPAERVAAYAMRNSFRGGGDVIATEQHLLEHHQRASSDLLEEGTRGSFNRLSDERLGSFSSIRDSSGPMAADRCTQTYDLVRFECRVLHESIRVDAEDHIRLAPLPTGETLISYSEQIEKSVFEGLWGSLRKSFSQTVPMKVEVLSVNQYMKMIASINEITGITGLKGEAANLEGLVVKQHMRLRELTISLEELGALQADLRAVERSRLELLQSHFGKLQLSIETSEATIRSSIESDETSVLIGLQTEYRSSLRHAVENEVKAIERRRGPSLAETSWWSIEVDVTIARIAIAAAFWSQCVHTFLFIYCFFPVRV